MPLFIDMHRKVEGLSLEGVTAGHQQDVAIQARFGVRFIRYWYDEATGKIFCLSEAPNGEAIVSTHLAGCGLTTDEVVEVREGA